MKNLFENLNNLNYTIDNKVYVIKDIFDLYKSFKAIEKYQTDLNYYYSYEIIEGEKWEDLVIKHYGNKNLNIFWILVILNDIIDIFYDFPLTSIELENSTGYSTRDNTISLELFNNIIDLNDEKRIIKILKKEYLSSFENDFFKALI